MVRDYLTAAGIAVREPRRRRPHSGLPSKPASEVTTDPGQPKPASEVTADPDRPRQPSRCELHREFIESSMRRGRNATAIWQDLVDQHGFGGSYQSVKRFVRRLLPAEDSIAHPRHRDRARRRSAGRLRRRSTRAAPGVWQVPPGSLVRRDAGFSRKAVFLLMSSDTYFCELRRHPDLRGCRGVPEAVEHPDREALGGYQARQEV